MCNQRSEKQGGGSTSLICDLMAKDLLYPLSIIDGAGRVQESVEMLENLILICSLFLQEDFSRTTFIVPKIVYIKKL